jgi:hypothetical protein
MYGFIQPADRCLRLNLSSHFHEAKAFASAAVTIGDHIRTRDRTKL